MPTITVIIGDGISREVADSAMKVINKVKNDIDFDIKNAGVKVFEETGSLMEDGLIESISKNKVALKGPIATPIGKGFRSINVHLRKEFNLYANIRPIKTFGNFTKYTDVDVVIFRENTEDLYAGVEKEISKDEMHSIKIITRQKSEQIAKEAFEYAKKNNRKKVTVVTKANIMKLTDGLFLQCARNIANNYPEIELEEMLIDNMCMQLVLDPTRYDVILTENLYGDILSDLCAGFVGGLGLAPSANIGKDISIFEAVHGTAPDIAFKDLANPTALILSSAMMLNHMGFVDEGNRVKRAVEISLQNKEKCTRDLGGNSGTIKFTDYVISNL